jgi:O-antigen/teichoic acid export membrane protein
MLGIMWGQELMLFVFGGEYREAGELLFWLLLSLLFILPNYILTQGAIAMGREKGYAWGAVGAAVINIVLNLLWIPRFGVLGAAWATIAAEGCLFLGLGWVLLRSWRASQL